VNTAFIFALLLVFWLVAMLYVGPTYFRCLGQLMERLKSHHYSKFELLGEPSMSILEMKMSSTAAVVWFVLRKDYRELADPEIVRLGDATRIRLLFSLAGVFIVLGISLSANPL
jgi:hypothetical protein